MDWLLIYMTLPYNSTSLNPEAAKPQASAVHKDIDRWLQVSTPETRSTAMKAQEMTQNFLFLILKRRISSPGKIKNDGWKMMSECDT